MSHYLLSKVFNKMIYGTENCYVDVTHTVKQLLCSRVMFTNNHMEFNIPDPAKNIRKCSIITYLDGTCDTIAEGVKIHTNNISCKYDIIPTSIIDRHNMELWPTDVHSKTMARSLCQQLCILIDQITLAHKQQVANK